MAKKPGPEGYVQIDRDDDTEPSWDRRQGPNAGSTGSHVYTIPAQNLPDLVKRLDKLVKKANKLGVGQVGYAIGPVERLAFASVGTTNDRPTYMPLEQFEARRAEILRRKPDAKLDPPDIVYFTFYPVTVTGTTPRLAGWDFVGTIQHLTDDQGKTLNILRIVPGYDGNVPEKYRHADASRCDHCCLPRNRKDTYLVHSVTTGEWKQVGRNCTQDFLGNKDPQDVAYFLESLFALMRDASDAEGGGEGGGYGREEAAWPMLEFLEWIAGVIRKDGWLSRGKAHEMGKEEEATATLVLGVMPPAPKHPQALRAWEDARDYYRPSSADKETAEKALDLARETIHGRTDLNDYLHNLYVATSQPFVTERTAGITASLIPWYQREVGIRLDRERQKASEWFGTEGERVQIYLTLQRVIDLPGGQYGPTFLHIFKTREGNVAIWFGSHRGRVDVEIRPGSGVMREERIEEGVEYLAVASIKDHDEREGVKQTILTRVKFLSDQERAEIVAKEAAKAEKEAAKAAKAAAKEAARIAKDVAKAEKEAAKAAKAAAKAKPEGAVGRKFITGGGRPMDGVDPEADDGFVEALAYAKMTGKRYMAPALIPGHEQEALAFWVDEDPIDREHARALVRHYHAWSPVVLDIDTGTVVDGRHRAAAALAYGLDLNAVVISATPLPGGRRVS